MSPGTRSAPSAQLAAVVRAGPYRIAVPASAVREVIRLGDGGISGWKDPVALEPLATLLAPPNSSTSAASSGSGPGSASAQEEIGWVVWLGSGEGSVALGVEIVEGVLDVRESPFFNLPRALGVEPTELFRGVLMLGQAPALEVRPEILMELKNIRVEARSPKPARFAVEPVAKALIISAAGRSFGFALPQVLSVQAKPVIAPVPRVLTARRGVTVHAQTLHPVLDLGLLLFGVATVPEFGVVVEIEGTSWVVLAEVVRGMRGPFRPAGMDAPNWLQDERGERALFPLFASDAGPLQGVV
jgi:hypothetical protein